MRIRPIARHSTLSLIVLIRSHRYSFQAPNPGPGKSSCLQSWRPTWPSSHALAALGFVSRPARSHPKSIRTRTAAEKSSTTPRIGPAMNTFCHALRPPAPASSGADTKSWQKHKHETIAHYAARSVSVTGSKYMGCALLESWVKAWSPGAL